KDGVVCIVTLWNNVPLVVTPPPHIELKIVETDPGLRGDTATGGQKPAKLETGAVVRVPLFINEGEVIRIDTRTGEYISRAKQYPLTGPSIRTQPAGTQAGEVPAPAARAELRARHTSSAA